MFLALAFPTILLMVLAGLVTRALERAVPESIPGLVLLALISVLVTWGMAAGLFAGLYLWQDSRLAGLLGEQQGLGHLLRLGAKSALIWGPVVALTVVTAPRRWRNAVW